MQLCEIDKKLRKTERLNDYVSEKNDDWEGVEFAFLIFFSSVPFVNYLCGRVESAAWPFQGLGQTRFGSNFLWASDFPPLHLFVSPPGLVRGMTLGLGFGPNTSQTCSLTANSFAINTLFLFSAPFLLLNNWMIILINYFF